MNCLKNVPVYHLSQHNNLTNVSPVSCDCLIECDRFNVHNVRSISIAVEQR